MENLTDDYYEFIGVKRDATNDEIKEACNKLLLKYHPDKCKDVWADGITKRIYEIKDVLLDKEKRKAYDKTLLGKNDKSQDEHAKNESQARKDKESEERERKAREEAERKRWEDEQERKRREEAERKSWEEAGRRERGEAERRVLIKRRAQKLVMVVIFFSVFFGTLILINMNHLNPVPKVASISNVQNTSPATTPFASSTATPVNTPVAPAGTPESMPTFTETVTTQPDGNPQTAYYDSLKNTTRAGRLVVQLDPFVIQKSTVLTEPDGIIWTSYQKNSEFVLGQHADKVVFHYNEFLLDWTLQGQTALATDSTTDVMVNDLGWFDVMINGTPCYRLKKLSATSATGNHYNLHYVLNKDEKELLISGFEEISSSEYPLTITIEQ